MTKKKNDEPTMYDALIVGCGPVGAALANQLRLYGHRVAIFDRDHDVFEVPRAMAFDDETLRIFDAINLMERIEASGNIYNSEAQMVAPGGKILMEMTRDTLGDAVNGHHGYFFLNVCDQPTVERFLRETFDDGPGTVDTYLGHNVYEVNGDGPCATLKTIDSSTGEERSFQAEYLVGCDGLSSLVRRSMGVGRIDLDYSEQYLVVDAIVDDKEYFEGCMIEGGRYRFDPKRSGITAKGLHGHIRMELFRHPDHMPEKFDETADFTDVTQELIASEGFDPDKLRVIRMAPYSFYASTAEHWRRGRMLLAGDAAHVTPPWTGQGLNMGFRDTANLAFKLDLVLKGNAPHGVLDTYQQERQASSLATIKGAINTGKQMTAENNLSAFARDGAMALARNNRTVLRAMHKMSVRKPSYKKGLLGKTHRQSGKAMFQPKVIDTSGDLVLLDKLVGLKFALVTLDRPVGPSIDRFVDELGGVVLVLGADLRDGPDPTLSEWFAKNKARAVLMRPDRYIYDAGSDGNSLCRSLLDRLA